MTIARRLIAALLGFVIPGAGQVVSRSFLRGVVLALGSTAVGVIALVLFTHLSGIGGIVLAIVPVLIYRTWCAWDAYVGNDREIRLFRAFGRLLAFLPVILVVDTTALSLGHRVFGAAWRIPSASMSPVLIEGDYILAEPLHREPIRGDIVTLRAPFDTSKILIKRVIAVAGDTIEMRKRVLLLNNRETADPHAYYSETNAVTRDTWGPLVVPPSSYFVIGDNRDDSVDSRFFGFVKRTAITGFPTRIYFSRDPAGPIRWRRFGVTIQIQ